MARVSYVRALAVIADTGASFFAPLSRLVRGEPAWQPRPSIWPTPCVPSFPLLLPCGQSAFLTLLGAMDPYRHTSQAEQPRSPYYAAEHPAQPTSGQPTVPYPPRLSTADLAWSPTREDWERVAALPSDHFQVCAFPVLLTNPSASLLSAQICDWMTLEQHEAFYEEAFRGFYQKHTYVRLLLHAWCKSPLHFDAALTWFKCIAAGIRRTI